MVYKRADSTNTLLTCDRFALPEPFHVLVKNSEEIFCMDEIRYAINACNGSYKLVVTGIGHSVPLLTCSEDIHSQRCSKECTVEGLDFPRIGDCDILLELEHVI